MTIKRLFIANRGEIALRVLRTAHAMGIATVLGVSEADSTSLPARLAGATAVLGPGPSPQSYLAIDRVVAAAVEHGCDAVHPGYGFLSENAAFARAVAEVGMIFVGPAVQTLEGMGDKLAARALALAAGLPVLPGGPAETAQDVTARAQETGYPLLLK
ncbi:biotin carboxylase N-terminal domain-containing protein, partial [Novosphingobium sp. B-7]|uniref:biotin carboxylase N-terminal domain-containing protein n=1 Tax=Novosphingobium sp. B-7 TaxID=1298855 RepID=UPI0003B54FEF